MSHNEHIGFPALPPGYRVPGPSTGGSAATSPVRKADRRKD
jgi:hypothetical protein